MSKEVTVMDINGIFGKGGGSLNNVSYLSMNKNVFLSQIQIHGILVSVDLHCI